MRPLAAMLVLFSLTLAGCSSNDPEGTVDPEESDDDVPSTPPSPPPAPPAPPPPPPPAPPENHAPQASLSASAEEGELPLLVEFTIDGSDEDDDALSWSLDADGDGEADADGDAVPGSASFTYDEPGLYAATLTVSDGEEEDSAVLMVDVSEAAPEGLLLAGTVSDPCPACSVGPIYANDPTEGQIPDGLATPSPAFCQSFVTGEPGKDCVWFNVTAEMKGKAFNATSTGGDPDMVFTNTCKFPADPDAPEAPEPYDPEAEQFFYAVGPESGTIPEEADCVILWEYQATGAQTIELRIA